MPIKKNINTNSYQNNNYKSNTITETHNIEYIDKKDNN